ncbi:LysM peptidoglycan-binding domain-containing protein [Cryptosporangium sp. NPDC048952]|uniref:LysM peptidoglycan-binding domain-containing protein n=1 Tax=Cryptosporangium sp. NPDC048952 TaxID=3363961 RepID=UPI00371D927A
MSSPSTTRRPGRGEGPAGPGGPGGGGVPGDGRGGRARQVLSGVVALGVLLGALVGVPVLLAVLGGNPLPDHVPSLAEAGEALTSPDDGTLFLQALAVVGWVGWATFALSVLVELPAAVRRRPAPRLPGLRTQQRIAATLIAAVALIGSSSAVASAATPPAQVSIGTAPVTTTYTGTAPWSSATPRHSLPPDLAPPHAAPPEGAPRAAAPPEGVSRAVASPESASRAAAPPESASRAVASPEGASRAVASPESVPRAAAPFDDAARGGGSRTAGPHGSASRDVASRDAASLGTAPLDARRAEAALPEGRAAGAEALPPLPVRTVVFGGVPGSAVRPVATGGETYVVAPGDRLADVAARFLGDPDRYPELASANSLSDADEIRPGQRIVLPSHARDRGASQYAAGPVQKAGDSYVVAPGDQLSDVAERFLGDADRYPELATGSGLEDPDDIRPSQRIQLPPGAQDRGSDAHATGRVDAAPDFSPQPPTPAPGAPAPGNPAPSTPKTPAPRTPTPAPSAPAPSAPAPSTPAPGQGAPGTAAPSTPAPRSAAPSTPAPSTAAPKTPAPKTPAPGHGAPGTAAPSTLAPTAPPAPRTPAPGEGAPGTAAPSAPAPKTAVPKTPAPSAPAPGTAAPSRPAPGQGAPGTAAPSAPTPSTPAPGQGAPGTAAPPAPAPGTAAPPAPAPGTAAPKAPAPRTGAPDAPGPGTTAPSARAPGGTARPGSGELTAAPGGVRQEPDNPQTRPASLNEGLSPLLPIGVPLAGAGLLAALVLARSRRQEAIVGRHRRHRGHGKSSDGTSSHGTRGHGKNGHGKNGDGKNGHGTSGHGKNGDNKKSTPKAPTVARDGFIAAPPRPRTSLEAPPAAKPDANKRLDAALRALSTALVDREGDAMPDVTGAWIERGVVRLVLDRPCADPPAPWTGSELSWELPADADLPDTTGVPAPLPMLVTVGTRSSSPLLLDVERLGVITLTGDTWRADDLLRYVGAELAGNPWSDDLEILVAGLDEEQTNNLVMIGDGRIEPVPTIADGIGRMRRRVSQALGVEPDAPGRHAAKDETDDEWAPTVLLASDPDLEETIALGELDAELATTGRCGVGVVASIRGDLGRWPLDITGEGAMSANFIGVRDHELLAARLSPSRLGSLAELFVDSALVEKTP